MLSVLIETHNSDDELAKTLASLVGGSVDGMVREVIVADRGSTDQTRKVADVAGCEFVAHGDIAKALAQAKGDWLLVLEPGARLAENWMEPAERHIAKAAMPARFTKAAKGRTPFLARLTGSKSALAEGLLIRKAQALALSKDGRNAEGLARGLSTKQISAGIYPAERAKK